MNWRIPRINEDVVVCVEKNKTGSSLLVKEPQKPQTLKVGSLDVNEEE